MSQDYLLLSVSALGSTSCSPATATSTMTWKTSPDSAPACCFRPPWKPK